ncbi:MAG: flagellar hook protein FlgE [Aquabacterium sp.]|nr:flagellar hook protein FlgE [Aquabacterium sp.]
MGFQQGLSGLNISSKNLEVIGNNVANANTFGAKASRAEFADMYAASLGGGGSNGIGIGARLASVAQQFTQGNITATSNAMDLAINGRGFFALQTPQGETVYSRNGQFKRDEKGYVINNDKHQLLGQALDETGVASGPGGTPIILSNDGSAPLKASEVKMTANLDVRGAPKTLALDISDSKTYNFVTSQTAYGDNGAPIALNYYFRKTTEATPGDPSAAPPVAGTGGVWDVYMTADGNSNAASVNKDGAGNPAPIGTLSFNPDGSLPVGTVLTVPSIPGGKNGQPLTGVTVDLSTTTEYSGAYSVTDLSGGGYAQGNLSDFLIENDGTIKARYTNGQSKSIARVQLSDFKNLNGMQPVGSNEWKATSASGDPLPLGTPGTGIYGLLQAGALEESNVDMTAELVNMIVAQRSYQANAQTIKAEDQVLQTLVNLR